MRGGSVPKGGCGSPRRAGDDRSRMEQALRESPANYENLFEHAIVGIFRTTPDGHFLMANPALLKMLGFRSFAEISRYNLETDEFLADYTRQEFKEQLHREGRITGLESEWRRRDGSTVHVRENVRAVRGYDGGIVCYEGTVEDISDRKMIERQLRESEELFRNVFDQAVIGIYRTTPEGRFLMANPALVRMLGYANFIDLFRSNVVEGYRDASQRDAFRTAIEAEGKVMGMESVWVRKDGSTLIVSENAVAVRDDDGEVKYYEGSVEDITERKLMERKLQEGLQRYQIAMAETVETMAKVVEIRDPYTAGHQERTARLAEAIARELGMGDEQVNCVYTAALIHDIGKVAVPLEILSKPTGLNEHELKIIQNHPVVGHDILKDITFPWPVASVVLQHHERSDGSGYPRGLSGDELLPEAKILIVADIVESMASHRPYRPSRGLDAALEEISSGRGTLYDGDVADACLRLFREKDYRLEG